MALQLTGAFKRDALPNLQARLPAIVIGGGLTAIDTATELMAYYPRPGGEIRSSSTSAGSLARVRPRSAPLRRRGLELVRRISRARCGRPSRAGTRGSGGRAAGFRPARSASGEASRSPTASAWSIRQPIG